MSKLPTKTNGLLLRYFTKPHLIKFLIITIVLFLIPAKWVQSTRFCFDCSKLFRSMENFHIQVELLRSIFKCNNYPVNIIDQCIKNFRDKLYVPEKIVRTVRKKELLVVLRYLGTFYLNLRKCLYKSASKYHNAI